MDIGRILLTNFTSMHKNIFRLSPHSTHLTQPLDVGCFQPFKHYLAEAIDNTTRLGEGDFGKLEFLAKFQTIRTKPSKNLPLSRHSRILD